MKEEELIEEAKRLREEITEFIEVNFTPPDSPGMSDKAWNRHSRDMADWKKDYEQRFREEFSPQCLVLLEEFKDEGAFDEVGFTAERFKNAFSHPGYQQAKNLPNTIDELIEAVEDC